MVAAAARIRLIVLDVDVTDLPACAGRSCHHLSVDDDAAADTCAERGEHHVGTALSAAAPHLAERRHIRVISGFHRHLQHPAERLVDVDHAPAEIDCLMYDAIIVHRSRNTDPDSCDFLLRDVLLRRLIEDRLCDIGENLAAVLLFSGRYLPLLEHVPLRVEQSDLYRCSTQVHTKTILAHFSHSLYIHIFLFTYLLYTA